MIQSDVGGRSQMRCAARVSSITVLSVLVIGAGAIAPPMPAPPPPAQTPPMTAPATTEPTLAQRAAAIDTAAAEPDGERVVLGHVSRKLRVSAETLRAQRMQTGLGWGELLIANRLAAEVHAPLDEIIAEARDGRTWERIATERGADLAWLTADVRASEETIEQRSEDKSPHTFTVPGRGQGQGRGGAGRARHGS